jgi:hypothetical protein
VINAPQAAVSLSGNGAAFGSIIGNSITLNGNGGFHYDTSLGASPGFAVASWNEWPVQ